jgi:hypothetical protein
MLSEFADQADHLDMNVQQQLANEDNEFAALTVRTEKTNYATYRDGARDLLHKLRTFLAKHDYDQSEIQHITPPLISGTTALLEALGMMANQLRTINNDQRNWLPSILTLRDNLRDAQQGFAKNIKDARSAIANERNLLGTL